MSDDLDRDQAAPATTSRHSPSQPDAQLVFLEELVEEHAVIAGDVIQIDADTWAIHGTIAVDGDVIMAEYESEAHARGVLDELTAEERADFRSRAGS
jgi:hypothetical protein